MTVRLGPPLDHLLAPAPAAGPGRPRGRPVPGPLPRPRDPHGARCWPGAHEALAAVRAHGGPGASSSPASTADNAQRHHEHLRLDVDHLESWVWGVGKAEVLRREGAWAYVGDHVHDVEGALAADVLSVSVLTGGSTRDELEEAGTDVVLDDLSAFPAWLDAAVRDRSA